MAKRYEQLSDEQVEFINQQKLYFVATAAAEGSVNLSPKGFDSLRVLEPDRLVWMNITGSGNETAAHLLQNPRMTIMFCSFAEQPKILRLYGTARVLHPRDKGWRELAAMFEPHPGARQLIDLHIRLVQTSCGFGVPRYDYRQARDNMDKWLVAKGGAEGIREYWRDKNQQSLDGLPTGIMDED